MAARDRMARHLRPLATAHRSALAGALGRRIRDLGRGRRALHRGPERARRVFGVYTFLETQGARFVRPGPAGEAIPAIADVTLPSTPIVEIAHYRHRGVCIEGATSLDHALGMVDWCRRRRGSNTVFLQFIHSGYFYNQWYERKYNPKHAGTPLTEAEALQYDEQLIAAMQRQRADLPPRWAWLDQCGVRDATLGWVTETAPVPPDAVRWLAEVKGERKLFADIPINTELCYSFQPAFDAFVETIVRYCEAHPELDVVHVWLSDAFNNKCECADCRPLTDRRLVHQVVNALSEALHHRTTKARVSSSWPISSSGGRRSRCRSTTGTATPSSCSRQSPAASATRWAIQRATTVRMATAAPQSAHGLAQNAFYRRILPAWRQAFAGDSSTSTTT